MVLICGGQTSKILDKGSIEYLGPYGLQKLLLSISKIINNFSNGVITNYALYIIVGIMAYLIYINSLNIMFIIPFLLIILLTITIGFYNKNNLEQ
jgi:NADH-ubiquinone oxidoreductase chain 5